MKNFFSFLSTCLLVLAAISLGLAMLIIGIGYAVCHPVIRLLGFMKRLKRKHKHLFKPLPAYKLSNS